MPVQTLEELLIEEIKDLYDAEKQLTKALPKMVKAATNDSLKVGFTEHLEQTKGHVLRLEEVFEALGQKPKAKPCAAMKGLIEEGQEQTQQDAKGAVMDLMLIAAAQKVEHYEISGYGTARAIAEAIGNNAAADLLLETEDEEAETDSRLTEIARELMAQVNRGMDNRGEEAPPKLRRSAGSEM